MSPRAARRIRGGIIAARADASGVWKRPAVWAALGYRAYNRELSRLLPVPGERLQLAKMRLLAAKERRR